VQDAGPGQDHLLPVWVAIGVLCGMLVGAAAGVASWLDDGRVPHAVLVGGAAFGGTVTLAILLIATLRRR
jgi:hypothetical protein